MSDSLPLAALSDKKREKINQKIQQLGLTLNESKLWNPETEPGDKDFSIYSILTKFWVKHPNPNRKDYGQISRELIFLRNYIYSIGALVPDETFLNTFENFDKTGNEETCATVQRFGEITEQPRGVWLQGPVSSGKSHLLYAVFAQQVYQAIDRCFQGLDKGTYNQCPFFAKMGREGSAQAKVVVINYMTEKLYSTEPFCAREFRPDREGLFLLDDVAEAKSGEVLEGLLSMQQESVGQVLITSNSSLSDWINRNAGGKSSPGIEDRLRTFMHEYKMVGRVAREKARW